MDDEIKRLKWVAIAGLVLVVSLFYSCEEMRYTAFGRKAEASLLRVDEQLTSGRRGRSKPMYDVHYQFTEPDGTDRKESHLVSRETELPIVKPGTGVRGAGGTINVQYIAGSPGASRLLGTSNTVWVIVTVIFLGFFAFKGVQFWRSYKS